jgi:hypothetical protein
MKTLEPTDSAESTAESTKETPQVALDSCPECDAPLHARREVWFTGVSLGGDGSIITATPRSDMDEVWRVYCTRGHEIAPALVVAPRRLAPRPPGASEQVVSLGTAVNEGQSPAARAQPQTTTPESVRLAAVPSPRATAPTRTEPETTRVTPPPATQPPPPAQRPVTQPQATPQRPMTQPQATQTPVRSEMTAPPVPPAASQSTTETPEDLLPMQESEEAAPETETGMTRRQRRAARAESKHRARKTARTSSQRTALTFGWILFVLGALAIATALVFFTVTAGHLPSFMGRIDGSTLYRRKPGVIVGAAGVILWIASVFAFTRARVTPGPDDLIVGFE